MTTFFLAVAVATAVNGNLLAEEADARAVLSQTAKVYGGARDFAASIRSVVKFKMMGTVMRQTVRQSVVYERPNRLWLQSTMGLGGVTRTVICDGRHVYLRQDWAKEYIKRRAPDTLHGIMGIEDGITEYLETMVNIPVLLDGVELASRIRDARVERTGTYRGAPVYIIGLLLASGHAERLWIDRDSFIIHKLEFYANPQSLSKESSEAAEPRITLPEEETPSTKGAPQQPDDAALNAVLQALASPEVAWTERYSNIRLNAGIPSNQFRFHPRPGEKLVKRLSSFPLSEADFRSQEAAVNLSSHLVGKPAPDFELPTLEGYPLRLSELRGKPVLLYFWDSQCPFCLAQLPDIEALHREFVDRGLEVIGINLDGTPDEAKGSVAREEVTFTVLWLDPHNPNNSNVETAYQPRLLPRLLAIDAMGTVHADLTGYHDRSALVEALRRVGL